ncbi:MAG TPA: cell division protein FtsZ [Candidatus Pacearchaeota archaeon]|nr:cell division protein FtsZ [Candidatus Pacearchaeota archaeon]
MIKKNIAKKNTKSIKTAKNKAPAAIKPEIKPILAISSAGHKNFDLANIKIKVIGVGGGGCSIVGEIANIIPRGKKISFCAANTDIQSLNSLPQEIKKIVLGKSLTHGLGCGMSPELGAQSAEMSKEEISREIENCDFCIIISALGGGTGSGATPLFAELAKDQKKLSLGIFTLPFKFEGDKRAYIAHQALQKIRPNLSASVIIPNENIFKIIDSRTAIRQSFSAINKQLAQSIKGLLETLYDPGLINIDFADFKTILEGSGRIAYQASVEGERKDLPQMVEKLLSNPLVEYGIIPEKNSKVLDVEKILFNVTGPSDLRMAEVEEVSNSITQSNLKAKIIFGILIKSDKTCHVRITLLAIGDEKSGGFKINSGFAKKPEIKTTERSKPKTEHKPPTKQKNIAVSSPHAESKKRTDRTEEKDLKEVVRRNAVELKKEEEKAEKEILDEEQKWDIPAFLRIKDKK